MNNLDGLELIDELFGPDTGIKPQPTHESSDVQPGLKITERRAMADLAGEISTFNASSSPGLEAPENNPNESNNGEVLHDSF